MLNFRKNDKFAALYKDEIIVFFLALSFCDMTNILKCQTKICLFYQISLFYSYVHVLQHKRQYGTQGPSLPTTWQAIIHGMRANLYTMQKCCHDPIINGTTFVQSGQIDPHH